MRPEVLDEAYDACCRQYFETMVTKLFSAHSDEDKVEIAKEFSLALGVCKEARELAQAILKNNQRFANH